MPCVPFDVRRDGEPIESITLRNPLPIHITYSRTFEEWEAASSAGLDMWQWETGGYSIPFMHRVVAWHRLHQMIEQSVQDAVSRASKKGRASIKS